MAKPLPNIIAHLRACIEDGSIKTTLIQTEDLSMLCDAAEMTINLPRAEQVVRDIRAINERLGLHSVGGFDAAAATVLAAFNPPIAKRDSDAGGSKMTNVVNMPEPPKPPELLVGPFQQWRVQVDGRIIPRLTGFHEGDKIALVVDGRFSALFAPDDASQAAWLIAQAMAIGEGYSHLGAENKDRPFAPNGVCLGEIPSR